MHACVGEKFIQRVMISAILYIDNDIRNCSPKSLIMSCVQGANSDPDLLDLRGKEEEEKCRFSGVYTDIIVKEKIISFFPLLMQA